MRQAAAILTAILVASAALRSRSSTAEVFSMLTRPPKQLVVDADVHASFVLPLEGDVYPRGLYHVVLNIGDPPKSYFLDLDTGSDLTWVQCDVGGKSVYKSPNALYKLEYSKLVRCDDDICEAIHKEEVQKPIGRGCRTKAQCDYEVTYADQASSLGSLVRDTFSLRLSNGTLARPSLVFGCGYNQKGGQLNMVQQVDGVLGLSNAAVGLPSQLGRAANVFGHCIGRRGGYFFFGDHQAVPPGNFTWVPISSHPALRGHYSPGMADVYFGSSIAATKQPTVIDSGSTYSYFSSQTYSALLRALEQDLSGSPLKQAPEDHTMTVCWKTTTNLKLTDLNKYFKSLTLRFPIGDKSPAAQLDVPPENYLIISKFGNACLGILNGTEANLGHLNVIGDISMQDMVVSYDNGRNRIGWGPVVCGGLDKSVPPSPL